MNHHLVLAQNGTHHQAWLECEGYWSPKVGGETILGQVNTQFDKALAAKLKTLIDQEAGRLGAG